MTRTAIISHVAAAGLGLTAGWWIYRAPAPVIETPAVEVRNADGSMTLERKPGAKPNIHHDIPEGGKPVRLVSVTVRSKQNSGSPDPDQPTDENVKPAGVPGAPCPDIRVDLTLSEMPDGSRRVTASSPDGEIIGGVDVPVIPEKPKLSEKRWAAGGYYGLGNAFGGFIQRDVGPFVATVSAGVIGSKADARVSIGLRF